MPEARDAKCWSCGLYKEISWNFCPGCGAVLSDNRKKLRPDRRLDIAFLYDTYSYSWWNHYSTGLALYNSIVEIGDLAKQYDFLTEEYRTQRVLRAKIFTEFIALLEVFGSLCLAIKGRNKTSVRWTYTNTEPKQVTQLYHCIVKLERFDLLKFLRLPSVEKVAKAAAASGLLCAEVEKLEESYEKIGQNIKVIAQQYIAQDQLLVRGYNKLKHCFPLIEGDWAGDIDNSRVNIYTTNAIAHLSMDQSEVDKQIHSMKNVTLMGAELLAMCKSLDDIGLLIR